MCAQESSTRGEFQEVLASLAAIDRLKSRDEVLAREANLSSRKADVALRVRDVYSKQGVVVSDDLIAKGVDAYFDQRLRWTKTELGAAAAFARFWVNRVQIVKVTALSVVSLAAVGMVVDFGIVKPVHAYQLRENRKIQTAWITASSEVDAAEARLKLILKGAEHEIEGASAQGGSELAAAASLARESLQKAETRVQELTNDAKKDQVPVLAKVGDEGLFANAVLEGAEAKPKLLANGEKALNEEAGNIGKVVEHLHGLRTETQALDQSWSVFNSVNPPAALVPRVAAYRQQALEVVRNFGPRESVANQRVKIDHAVEDLRSLQSLPQEIHAAADRARKIAVEPKALVEIAAWEREASDAIESGNLDLGKKLVSRMHTFAAQLDQTYTVRIVNRASEYSRIWYNNPTHTDKVYYVVVEAITTDDTVLPLAITSEQDGSTRTVNCWAERVDFRTYEQVGDDKKDDGVIQNNIFAKKERGYIAPRYLMGSKAQGGEPTKGRLNSWPHPKR